MLYFFFMRLVLDGLEFILRPLLYAAGAAVTAGLYYILRKTPERTDIIEDSMQMDGVRFTPADSTAPEEKEQEHQSHHILKVSLAKAERKYEEAMESSAQLESEKSELISKVDQLKLELQEMKNRFSEMHYKCVGATKHLAQDMLKVARSSAEEQEIMFNWERHLFRASHAELSRKNQALQDTNAELVTQQTYLTAKVDMLSEVVDNLDLLFTEATGKSNKMKSESMKKQESSPLPYSQQILMILTNNKEFPMYEEAFKCSAQLDEDDLQVHNILCSVKELEEKLSDTEKMCDTLKREKEEEQKAHHNLKIQHGALKYRIMDCIKMLFKAHGIDMVGHMAL